MIELLKKIHLFDNLTEKELEKIQNICINRVLKKSLEWFDKLTTNG